MELQYLRYFKVIAELENMTRASEALHVAQPALSKTVRILEEELQVKLFNRKGKNIILNENGRILLKYTYQILNSLKDAKLEIAENNKIQENTVSIAMHAASRLIPPILLDFKKQYPNINFNIEQHRNKKYAEKNADFIIYSTKDKVIDRNVVTLLEEEILIAVPIDHPLAKKEQVYLEELASESFISLQQGKGLSDITNYYCRLAGFEPKIVLDSDDPATIRGLIAVGLGISFLPAITWKSDLVSNIKLLSISNFDCKRYIHISWKKGTYRSEASKLVCDYIIKFFKQLT
ncbi:LysR family transcriptional regulator [Lederbergia sp. NSJ-179]|uniref:LysR family transcriptional regulator n=1 Tax=Lederbergia sp. NSJ-179 TaxID=2931402 RepID=UPI001FD310CF|nr:LysR family transcriptional regulator [Lederbergia sp. NSJ-179]MCJ7840473.1 LysR family transcriptional regulator [Lederbergia sp. NSJ-179]